MIDNLIDIDIKKRYWKSQLINVINLSCCLVLFHDTYPQIAAVIISH